MDPGFEGLELVPRQSAPADLVGESGIREAVAHHPAAGGERRLDTRGEVLAAGGEHQHGFRFEVHRFVQQQLAQALAEHRAAGFAGLLDDKPARAQQRHGGGDLAALAGAVDAFEGDEAPTRNGGAGKRRQRVCGHRLRGRGRGARRHRAHGFAPLRMNRFTARLCSSRLRENSLLPSPRATK